MKNIRKIALYIMLGFAVLGGLFIGGTTLADPGGLRGILFTSAWAIPMIIMSWLGWRRPRIAFPILIVWTFGLLGLLIWQAIAPDWWRTVINSNGPIISIAIFALATPWTLYGYKRRTRFVALLLMAMPLLSAIATSNTGDNDHGPLVRGGSAMAIGLPVFIVGALYLVASLVDKQDDTEDEK